MKTKKILLTIVFVLIILGIMINESFAATFNLDVYFDGKTITMESENSDVGLKALNLLPEETDISYIKISNKGNQKVNLFMTATVVDDEDLLKILNVVVKNSAGTEVYKGNYKDFTKIEIALEKGKEETLSIQTSMPAEAGNEYQDKEANVKFLFEANGEEIKIENPKTNQSKIVIYTVLLVLAGGLAITLSVLVINKKKTK